MPGYNDFIFDLARMIEQGKPLGQSLKEVVAKHDMLLKVEARAARREQARQRVARNDDDEIPF